MRVFTAVALALSALVHSDPQRRNDLINFHNNSIEDTGVIIDPWSLEDAGTLQRRTDAVGIVPLFKKRSMYVGGIRVGTPHSGARGKSPNPQPLDVIFDMGTPTSWLTSINCVKPRPLHIYNSRISQTSSKVEKTFSGRYSSKSVKGMWRFSDVFDVGGIETKAQFGSATQRGEYFSQFDGVIGLAAFLPEDAPESFFSSFIRQHKDLPKTFAFYFGQTKKQFQLGVTMESIGHMEGYPMISVTKDSGIAGLANANIFVNDEPLFESSPGNIKTFFNSGFSLVLGPPDHVHQLYQKLGGQEFEGSYIIPCDNKHLVSFSWGDSSTKWKISLENLIFRGGEPRPGMCRGVIKPNRDVRGNLWTLGLKFMLDKHIVYDFANKVIHVGNAA